MIREIYILDENRCKTLVQYRNHDVGLLENEKSTLCLVIFWVMYIWCRLCPSCLWHIQYIFPNGQGPKGRMRFMISKLLLFFSALHCYLE